MGAIFEGRASRTGRSTVKTAAAGIAELVDRYGLDKTWRALIAHRVRASSSPDQEAMLVALGRPRVDADDLLDGLEYHELSVLYEFALAHASHDARKEAGQYFTPADVATEMARRALAIDNGGTWIDPCCGIGNLTYWLASVQPDPAEFLASRMILVDRDKLALLIASVLLTLEHGGARQGVFEALRTASKAADYLGDRKFRADNAIINPPYVVVAPDGRFQSSGARDLYAYFIERVLDSARGIVAITPQSFTNGTKFAAFRQVLTDRLATADIYCFDNIPDNIFRGVKFGSQNSNTANSTRAAILVGTTDAPERRFRISPLLRWKTNERARLFASMDEMLTEFEPTDAPFPKIGPKQSELYSRFTLPHRTLASLTVSGPTEWPLYVPTTPRYFITASKLMLGRASMRALYFPTEQDRDLAYAVLNSDLAYWWWRVFDGGMSLSERTLMSVPIPQAASVPHELIEELERSEVSNRVAKLNAGMLAENVKHPHALIERLTAALLGSDASALAGVRDNTVFTSIDAARAEGLNTSELEEVAVAV